MNTNHSPAPWSLRGDILRDANGVLLYRLTPLDEITIGEDMANRALIKAAPEMKAMLRRVVSAADCMTIIAGKHKLTEGQVLISEARALLAKVEGSP